jgi:hypothetical protein
MVSMHDELAELTAVWQRDAGNADALIAAVRREHKKQQWLLAGELAVCGLAIVAGVWLALRPGAPRTVGSLVVAYALAGIAITQWGRVALVRRLAQPVGVGGDAALPQRLALSAWLMSGLGVAFVAAVLLATGSTPAVLLSDPVKLGVTTGAAVLLAGVLVWQWRYGRRRAAQLARLLAGEDTSPR